MPMKSHASTVRPRCGASAVIAQPQNAQPSTHKVGTMLRQSVLRQGSEIGRSLFVQCSGAVSNDASAERTRLRMRITPSVGERLVDHEDTPAQHGAPFRVFDKPLR